MLLLDLLPTYRYSDPQGSESTKRAVVLATVCTSEGLEHVLVCVRPSP